MKSYILLSFDPLIKSHMGLYYPLFVRGNNGYSTVWEDIESLSSSPNSFTSSDQRLNSPT